MILRKETETRYVNNCILSLFTNIRMNDTPQGDGNQDYSVANVLLMLYKNE